MKISHEKELHGANYGANVELTMALTGSQRVKRWREKHREVYNLRRRNARKRQWENLQEMKRKAKEKGYEVDQWSQ